MDFALAVSMAADKLKITASEAEPFATFLFGRRARESGVIPDGEALERLEVLAQYQNLLGNSDWTFGALMWVNSGKNARAWEKRKQSYFTAKHLFTKLRNQVPLGGRHFIAPATVFYNDSPFGLGVFEKPKSRKEEPRQVALVQFDLHTLDNTPKFVERGGVHHFVLVGVQGLSPEVRNLFKNVPASSAYHSKDWRTGVVLAVEKACKQAGIPFAALNPKMHKGLQKIVDFEGRRAKNRIRSLAMRNFKRTYREAGLTQVGKYYKRI